MTVAYHSEVGRMKQCKRCRRRLPIEDFYKHALMADGYLSFCKDCTRIRIEKHRTLNLERIRQCDRDRSAQPHRKALHRRIVGEYNAAHPERKRAVTAVNNAVRDGRIVRQPCARCGKPISHGHHENYRKLLDVTWLCCVCHKQRHKEIRNEDNDAETL
jgi:hypothetical protein